MDTTLRPGSNSPLATGSANRALAPARTNALEAKLPAQAQTLPAPSAAPKRPLVDWDSGLQGNVARAQQALDYLERVAGDLEAVKSTLSAKLAGNRGGAADLDARVRQLSASLAARTTKAGGGVDAQLQFEDGQSAKQSFRITGFEPAVVKAAAPLTLAFSIGGAQVSASFEPDMRPEQIAQQLDRALAPMQVRAQLDGQGRLVFSTDEATWPAVRDGIVLSGRGRANTEAIPADLNLQGVDSGNADALRQNLREVVHALERVRQSQVAASAALSQAAAKITQPDINPQDLALSAQDFSSIAAGHDYQSLLALTSALSGVSRDRVLALLGLR